MRKEKLSIPQQIAYMESQGITFNHISKADATRFLENNTYYFKLKAYSKNFSKYSNTTNAGKYCGLDFAYLKDLSTIDAHLRKFIIKMALDVEHFLKVKLLRDFLLIGEEDGYKIIETFFLQKPTLKGEVIGKETNSNCYELIEKYKDQFAIWNIIEVLSFGQFIELYRLFYSQYKFQNDMSNMLLPIKFLRNAAAHNNCLINNMGAPYARSITPNQAINRFVSQIDGIPARSLSKKMANPVVHDFVVMLYVFNNVITSAQVKEKTFQELQQLFSVRITRHSEYYAHNELLTSHYKFVKKIVDFFVASAYNNA